MNYLGFAAAAMTAFAMGCSDPSTGDSGGNDATTDTVQPMAQTYTFVVDQLTIDQTDSPDVAHTGFNLDNYFSTDVDMLGCTHADFYSQFDNDQHCAMGSVMNEACTAMPNQGCARGAGCVGGVDNQLPTLANTITQVASADIRQTLTDTITQNKLALVIRVSGVNDPMNDDSIRVAIYRAFPTFTDNCTAVAGGREYSIDRSFLQAGATDVDAGATVAFDGKIVAGRIQVRAGAAGSVFNLPLSFQGYNLVLPLHELQMRANLTTGASGNLANGALGGWVAGDDVVMAVQMFAPEYVMVVRGVIGGLVDIQINNSCGDQTATPPTFGGIAVGLGVHAVPAAVSTTTPIATTQAAGTCGYAAPADGG